MKMFRWLLCHLLAITLLVSFILVFSFRDVLKEDLAAPPKNLSQSPQLNGFGYIELSLALV